MAKQDVAVINYTMYEGGSEYIGMTQVDLPSLQFMSTVINGSGIAGEIETVLIGQMKAMEITLKHTLLTRPGISISAPRMHDWEFREVQQNMDNQTGAHTVTAVKHVIRAFPKQMDGGSLKAQSSSDPNTVASVYYWAEYRDGEKVLELDPINYICYVDGTDYLAPVRAAMGK